MNQDINIVNIINNILIANTLDMASVLQGSKPAAIADCSVFRPD